MNTHDERGWKGLLVQIQIVLLIAACSGAAAEESSGIPATRIDVDTTMTALASSDGEFDPGGLVALDLFARNGRWSLLLEITVSPDAAGYAIKHPGEILRPDGSSARGEEHIAVAEFHYGFDGLGGEWSVGLLDSAAHIDTSAVANDEKTQFMSPEFVNNPLIGMPGGRVGIAFRRPGADRRPGFSALLMTGAEGFTEPAVQGNSVDRPARFLAIEADWQRSEVTTRLGAWEESADWRALPGSDGSRPVRGLYASIDGQLSRIRWNVRIGATRSFGDQDSAFVGMAAQVPVGGNALGVALGRKAWLGSRRDGSGVTYFEAYYRREVLPGWIVTPGIQWSRGDAGGDLRRDLRACLRMNLLF